jgi:hypothetical protein
MSSEPEERKNQAVNVWSCDLPRSADLVMGFRIIPSEGQDDQVILLGRELAANHQRQWEAEDSCRDEAAALSDIGEAKRQIDRLNARRVSLVERIDQVIGTRIQVATGLSLHTETLGSVVDRLAIAWVRTDRLSSDPLQRDRARAALRQLNELATAYDDLVRDIAGGLRRLPDWRVLKSYGSPT